MIEEPMVLPATPIVPPFPLGESPDLSEWSRLLHSSFRDSLTMVADRVENAVMVGSLSDRPDPLGTRQFFVDIDTGVVYLDVWDSDSETAEWIEVTHTQWSGEYNPSDAYALIGSVSPSEIVQYRISIFGGSWATNKSYYQEIALNTYTSGTGTPGYQYTHIGPTLSLKAGVRVYYNSATSKYDIYLYQGAVGGCAGRAIKFDYNADSAVPVIIGDFSTTVPSGTLVLDTTAHSTYPPLLLMDPADNPVILKRTSAAVDPSTSNYATSEAGIHKNTSSGNVFLAYNDGGTIKKVQLT